MSFSTDDFYLAGNGLSGTLPSEIALLTDLCKCRFGCKLFSF